MPGGCSPRRWNWVTPKRASFFGKMFSTKIGEVRLKVDKKEKV